MIQKFMDMDIVIVIFSFLYNALAHTVNQFMYFIGPTVNISKNHTWLHAILYMEFNKVKLAMT